MWILVLIDRLELCKPLFIVHIPSHDSSDLKHMQIIHRHKMMNRAMSLKISGHNLPHCACIQN